MEEIRLLGVGLLGENTWYEITAQSPGQEQGGKEKKKKNRVQQPRSPRFPGWQKSIPVPQSQSDGRTDERTNERTTERTDGRTASEQGEASAVLLDKWARVQRGVVADGTGA